MNKSVPLKYLHVWLSVLLCLPGCTEKTPLRSTSLPPSTEPAAITSPLAPKTVSAEAMPLQTPGLPREQLEQRFAVIDELVRSGDYFEAKNHADALATTRLSDQDMARLQLSQAQIALSMGEAETATSYLKRISPSLLDRNRYVDYLQAQAFAYSLLGRSLESVKVRIELMPLLSATDARKQNQNAILDALLLMPNAELQRQSQSSSGDLTGWIALSEIVRDQDQPDFDARLKQWRSNFPNHPADTSLLGNAAITENGSVRYPGSIAVFLPESGTFAAAGKALKAGIMAAFDLTSGNAYRPNLHFYDTTQEAPKELYRQAVDAGAELIIGPLAKEDVQNLADTTTLTIPVLALNHIQALEQDNLYQFSLSPMDDVAEITERARLDGHSQAVLLLPENAQTQRLADYFKEYWQAGGGALLKVQTYQQKTSDFSASIALLLNRDIALADSNSTAENPANADVIFIGGEAEEVGDIKKQVDAFGGVKPAIYALPSVHSGQPELIDPQTLNDVTFCSMPWTLNLSRLNWPGSARQEFPAAYLPLVAMGIDAFNLSARLRDLLLHEYSGETGLLTLAGDNRIKRHLTCARFGNGKPQIIDLNNTAENQTPEATGQILDAPVR